MIANFDQENYSKRSIPDNWSIVRFGDVFEILKSGNNPRSDLNNEGEYKYIHYGDIHKKWKGLLDCKKEFIPRIAGEKVSNLPHLQDGDLIIADASEDYEGLGVATEVINVGNQNIVAGLHTILARGDKDLLADGFKGYIQELRDFKNKLINISTGTTVFGISKTKLTDIQIIIPPLEEQHAIAEVLSDVDALIEAQLALIEKKRLIKHGVMQELLTGKRRLSGFSADWKEAPLGVLGEISSAGVDKKIRQDELPVRLLNYMDVYSKSFITSNDLIQSVTAPIQKAQKCSIMKGDVFFTPSSETPNDIANSAVSLEDIEDGVYSYHIVRFRLFEPENWDLLFRSYIFKTKYFFDQAEKICAGSGQRYVINLDGFGSLRIKYPKDKEEQKAISQIIYDLDNEIKLLQKRLEKFKLIKQGMMQELLTGRTRLV